MHPLGRLYRHIIPRIHHRPSPPLPLHSWRASLRAPIDRSGTRIMRMRPLIFPSRAMLALAAVSSATSTSPSLRGGTGVGELGDSGEGIDSSMWPFHSDTQSGITFERTETSCPLVQASAGATTQGRSLQQFASSVQHLPKSSLGLTPVFPQAMQPSPHEMPRATFDDGHCKSSDRYGGNACHYSWGDDITINYDGRLDGQGWGEDVYIEMSLKIDDLVHHQQTCPICGDEPCIISPPAIPKSWSIDLPKCPITPDMLAGKWKTKLPGKNPIPALLNGVSGTVVDGTVWLKKKASGEGNGGDIVLMMVKGNAHLK